MSLQRKLERAIDELTAFSTTSEIAEYLHAQGVYGLRGVVTACPIVEFVRRETGAQSVWVTGDRISVSRGAAWLATPKLLEMFINDVDDGMWPELQWVPEEPK